MKTHLNLGTTDLEGSIAFYSTLLGEPPAKMLPDYALFITDDPGLASSVERRETCCYANQTKVWGIDPEGRRWEVYTVHEEANPA